MSKTNFSTNNRKEGEDKKNKKRFQKVTKATDFQKTCQISGTSGRYLRHQILWKKVWYVKEAKGFSQTSTHLSSVDSKLSISAMTLSISNFNFCNENKAVSDAGRMKCESLRRLRKVASDEALPGCRPEGPFYTFWCFRSPAFHQLWSLKKLSNNIRTKKKKEEMSLWVLVLQQLPSCLQLLPKGEVINI